MQAKSENGDLLRGVALGLLIIAIVIAGLVYGRSFLIPIVIALLIANLISAGSDQLMRLGLPRPLATFGAILVSLIAIFAILRLLANQTDALELAWPQYMTRFEALTNGLSEYAGPNISQRIREAFGNLDLIRQVPGLVGSAGALLSTVALVTIYVGFLLAERGNIPGKILLLFKTRKQADKAKRTLSDISAGIRRYLWIKTIMSLLTGAFSYTVLKLLDVDFAEIWVLLIMLLNYIPNIGSIIGVVFPALLALLQFETMWQFFVIAALLAGGQFIIGNVIEPRYMGRTLNLSPFVVMVSLAFWGTIWGIAGAFLSIPLTAGLVIACGHIPSCKWIAILLSQDGHISDTGREDAAHAPG